MQCVDLIYLYISIWLPPFKSGNAGVISHALTDKWKVFSIWELYIPCDK